jgi:hypothetical protein
MRRVSKAGQIAFDARRSVIDCTIRGLVTAAAGVDAINTAGIPEKFELTIADDGFSRACTIRAKDNRTLERAFV